MTGPALALPFVRIPIDHPKSPRVGQPCRIGRAVAIRAYDPLYEDIARRRQLVDPTDSDMAPTHPEFPYAQGETPVSFQHTTWSVIVQNLSPNTARTGETVFYLDRLTDNLPDNPTNCAVSPGQYVDRPDAIAGLLLQPIEPHVTREVQVLLQYAWRDWHWLSCPDVERSPNVRNGEWVFRGTRVPLTFLFDHLQEGGNIDDFIVDYDTVSRDQVAKVLQHTAADLAKYADPPRTSPYPTPVAAPKS